MLKARILTYEDYAIRTIASHLHLLQNLREDLISLNNREAIHQWRITSRRLRDSLKVFKDLFPRKKRKAWSFALRTLAKSASSIRDIDIHIRFSKSYLGGVRNIQKKEEVRALLSKLILQREKLQPRLTEALGCFLGSKTIPEINSYLSHLSHRVSKKQMPYLFSVAQKRIEKRVSVLLSFEPFVSHPEKKKELHQMRIAAKHLRYCLESFQGLYGKKIELYIKIVLSIQDTLGDWHDYDVWAGAMTKNSVMDFQKKCRDKSFRSYREFVRIWKEYKNKEVWGRLADLTQKYERSSGNN